MAGYGMAGDGMAGYTVAAGGCQRRIVYILIENVFIRSPSTNVRAAIQADSGEQNPKKPDIFSRGHFCQPPVSGTVMGCPTRPGFHLA
jgi:hypothetical protein